MIYFFCNFISAYFYHRYDLLTLPLHFFQPVPCASGHCCLPAALPPASDEPHPMGKNSGCSGRYLPRSPPSSRHWVQRQGWVQRNGCLRAEGKNKTPKKKPPRTPTASITGGVNSITQGPGCTEQMGLSMFQSMLPAFTCSRQLQKGYCCEALKTKNVIRQQQPISLCSTFVCRFSVCPTPAAGQESERKLCSTIPKQMLSQKPTNRNSCSSASSPSWVPQRDFVQENGEKEFSGCPVPLPAVYRALTQGEGSSSRSANLPRFTLSSSEKEKPQKSIGTA